LLVTANVVPSSLILVTLMMEAIHFSETSVLIRAKRHTIPEDGILLHSVFSWHCSIKQTTLMRYVFEVKLYGFELFGSILGMRMRINSMPSPRNLA
jgi:hypothetical protein